MKIWLNYIIIAISVISMLFFVIMTILRMTTVRKHAKKYGMRKEVTDPWLYWISYISGFLLLFLKIIIWIFYGANLGSNIWLTDIIPSVFLAIFTRTIGKSVILRAEKKIYFNRLMTEIKDIHKITKENNRWILHTTSGKYPLHLSNTSVFKLADLSGAKVEENKTKKISAKDLKKR